MKTFAWIALFSGSLAIDASPTPETPVRQDDARPSNRPSFVAPVLTGISIDGDLSDWPETISLHSLDKLFHYDGQRMNFDGLKRSDQIEDDDLSATFTGGYDPAEQLLYLAVIVRDDTLIVSNDSHMSTDSVEVYVDGLRSDAKFSKSVPSGQEWYNVYDLSEIPVQQYVAIPGEGPIYGVDAGTNPVLLGGDLSRTRSRMAYRREGDVTIYEWAIEVFDRYPDEPTKLVPGKRIGFDLAVADEDLEASTVGESGETQMNRLTWIYWGPQWSGVKVLNAGSLGELILGD